MKIGFDAKRLFHNSTGLGHYSRTLIRVLLQLNEDMKIVLFDAKPVNTPLTNFFFTHPQVETITLDTPAWYYRSINLSKYSHKEKIDIYHGLSNELPVIRNHDLKYVVTIHDLLYQSFHDDFSFIDRNIYHIKTKLAIKNANVIVAISESTKKSIMESFPVDEKKIVVIYQTYDPAFNQPVTNDQINAAIQKHNLPINYNYFVGSVTYRKNIKVILEAMIRQPKDQRLPLVIAGNGTNYLKEMNHFIHQHHLASYIYHLPNLPRSEVQILFKNANAVIYPSLGEGFGLPVLEGIAANVPVITSNLSSLPEAGGDVALYFNPSEPDELVTILDSLDKRSFLHHTAEKRKKHLEKFQPANTVLKYYHEVYRPLV